MRQFIEIKKQHPDAILLFRVGDFYETFSDDAIIASEILGITLTRRANGAAQFVELAGFPHHALDTYLPKLVRAGKRVAICDQLEDPKTTKKLVKRGITELVTINVSINDTVLNHKENNFLLFGFILLKTISLGYLFWISQQVSFSPQKERMKVSTNCFLTSHQRGVGGTQQKRKFEELFGSGWLISALDDWIFTENAARDRLKSHFKSSSLKGFGVDHLEQGIIASGAILHYMDITQHPNIEHINSLTRIEEDRFVRLDKFTVRNLELLSAMNEGGKSLLGVLDKTISPMGSRLMRRWVVFPLKEVKPIEDRLNVVEHFFRDPELK